MQSCDVCKKPLGLLGKFRYAEGYICKECYKKASRQFTETIIRKNLAEIKSLCGQERDEVNFENFVITGRIGNYLLIDERNQKICILNNRMVNKTAAEPEFYDFAEITGSKIVYAPYMELEELEKRTESRKDDGVIRHLQIHITMKGGKEKTIRLLSNPVRIKSYAFRQSFAFAKRLNEEIKRLCCGG